MEDDFIERVENEIAHQIRNGREDVYIEIEDLNRLGYGMDKNKKGREYVNVTYLRMAINDYKRTHFRESLKVEVNPISRQQTNEGLKNREKNNQERD